MQYFIVLGCIIASTFAQRPSFAGILPKGLEYADVHSNFKTTGSSSTTTPSSQASNQGGASGSNLADRFNDVDTTTIKLPPEASGNVELIQWIEKWPQGNKPFWLLNAEHLNRQRHPELIGNNLVQTANRNSFENTYTLEDFFADIDREEYEKFNKNALQQLTPEYYSEATTLNGYPESNRNNQQVQQVQQQERQQRSLYNNYETVRALRRGPRSPYF